MLRLSDKLTDYPAFLSENFKGYSHFQDPTTIDFNSITFPSVNCTIPSFDKIIPDLGKTLYGQDFTRNVGINGNKQKFKNLGGIEMEIRSNPTGDANLKDVIQVGFQNKRLLFSTLVGVILIPEQVSGDVSGASATVVSISASIIFLDNIQGEFQVGESLTFLSSGATAVVVLAPNTIFHQITENVNPIPVGAHEYYFDEWFDTNLNPALSKRLPRAIWVNGYKDNVTRGGEVYSWTGGIATIVGITGTNLFIDATTTWRSLGFSEDASGNAYVIVNGVKYTLTTPSELDTSSINVTSTAGVSIGDTAFSRIEVDTVSIPLDHCRQVKGYMYYGSWKSREYLQSNAFNRSSSYTITNYNAIDNDLVLNISSPYTGTTQDVFHVEIDSINPAVNNLVFNGFGPNVLIVDSSGYTGGSVTENEYKIIITEPGGYPNAFGYEVYKNGVFNSNGALQNVGGVGSALSVILDGIVFSIPVSLVGDLPPASAAYTGVLQNGMIWTLNIKDGSADTFKWLRNGVLQASGVVITGGVQTLADGIQIQFLTTTGHSVGNFWDITAIPAVTRAWKNFYYNLPIRTPGEGYKYRLPSNFWTHETQEESIYVNTSYGEWSVVTTQLSADLLSETVSLTPLKQAGANKVLYPYLTGHLNDKIIYINTEHSLDTIGREQFLEKPQTGYLSDPVKLDFLASSFVGGRIKYFGKRLYISSPEDGITHCFDTFKGYWQAPKNFPEVGLLSIIGDNLVCHSNIRNRTFTMFTNTAGDNGDEYTVEIRTPYIAPSTRWKSSFSNMSFIEGYITGSPKLVHTVYSGIDGCGGTYPHAVEPVMCVAPDRAPFGEGSFGSHSFGSDIGFTGSHFNEIYKAYSPVIQYYLLSLGISCTTKSHTYSILNLGMNGMTSQTGNNSFVNSSNLAQNNS